MLTKRIIPCLDIKNGRTVKGVNFVDLRDAGDPVELAEIYANEGADELVFLDISATEERRKTLADLVYHVAEKVNIPFTVGGGISSIEDVDVLLQNGADKVSINSSAVKNPGEILFTSMDNDGTKDGFANEALAKLSTELNIPIIASGGAGNMQHFVDTFKLGKADAALAASVFHFKEIDILELKKELKSNGIPVRI